MLIVPASKVSVPLTVVNLTAVNTAPKARLPLKTRPAPPIVVPDPEQTQVLPVWFVNVAIPVIKSAAPTKLWTISPDVIVPELVFPVVEQELLYPLVVYVGVLVVPSCN